MVQVPSSGGGGGVGEDEPQPALAASKADTAVAGPLYRQALSLLNADVPAIFLYTPMNASAFRRDIGNVTIDPYSWLGTLGSWTRGIQ